MMLALLLSCGPSAEPIVAPEVLVPLPGPQLLRRASLDLRGVLPSTEELDAVESDPERWTTLRDGYLDDPAFADRFVNMLSEHWQTRVDVFDIVHKDYSLPDDQEFAFEKAVGEEPLRLMAHVAVNDLPWTDIVTADYTLANGLLASLWPLEHPGGEDWAVSHYTDGRPAAGVLSTNGMWWRYTTTNANMNRGRAAAISRLLMCEDYLKRPISFADDADAAISNDVDALTENPYCVGCHASIDPVAASLFGFWWLSLYSEIEESSYHPERELLGPEYLGVEPAWYGTPMTGLSDLGYHVASDTRFYSCAVETMATLLWRRVVNLDDTPELERLRQDFLRADLAVRPLLAELTETAVYQAGGFGIDADDEQRARERVRRQLTPDQLASVLADLTGFVWRYEGFEMMANDTYGYRVLGGGVDGRMVGTPQQEPGLTWLLVVKRIAQAAAAAAVQRDLVEGQGLLIAGVSLDGRPGDDAFEDALDDLHWRLYAVRAEADWRAEIGVLWAAVEAEDGAEAAWRTALTVMLRDPLLVSY